MVYLKEKTNASEVKLMAKKIYAVLSGRQTGLFTDWDECKRQVTGYKGAKFKGFDTREEALAYLGGSAPEADTDPAELTAYVDGSYNIGRKIFSYGVVILTPEGEVLTFSGAFSDDTLAKMRNVAGEIAASRFAIDYALSHSCKSIDIYYDYLGIERWATGEWKRNLPATQSYYEYCASAAERVRLRFIKVKGHSGDKYNDLADHLAKAAAGIETEQDDV